MHELVAVLLPGWTRAGCSGRVDPESVNAELQRLMGANLNVYYDGWGPVDPGEWAQDPSLSPPALGEVSLSGAFGPRLFPVFDAGDMHELRIALAGVITPYGMYLHSEEYLSCMKSLDEPQEVSFEDLDLFRQYSSCLVVVCDVHF